MIGTNTSENGERIIDEAIEPLDVRPSTRSAAMSLMIERKRRNAALSKRIGERAVALSVFCEPMQDQQSCSRVVRNSGYRWLRHSEQISRIHAQ